MMLARLIIIALVGGLTACGGSKSMKCDTGPYQAAVRAPRVQAPDDLDGLDELNELPLPASSPRAPRPEDAPCLEAPPVIITID